MTDASPQTNRSDPSTPIPIKQTQFFPSVREETMRSIIPHLDGKPFNYDPFGRAATDPVEEVGRVSEEKRVHFMLKGGILAAWTKTVVQIRLLSFGAKEALDLLPVKDPEARKKLIGYIENKFEELKKEMKTCQIPEMDVKYNPSTSLQSATNTYTLTSGKNKVGCASSEYPETLEFMEETKYCSMNCTSSDRYARVLVLAALCGAVSLDKPLEVYDDRPNPKHFEE